MTLAHAMWIHGHSMQIEYPDKVAAIWRAGFYIRVDGKPGTKNWFHFAIPTPVIVDDNRLRADSVMLQCRTGSTDAVITAIHVYDGAAKIAEHNGVNKSGNLGFQRFIIPAKGGLKPEVRFGIGISIGVEFGNDPVAHTMEFEAAGCDFLP
jgi:hypothetical protein